jgi:maltooligosyltrehalose trehalohydrolase
MLKAGIEKRELGMTLLPGTGARMLFWSPFANTVQVKIRGKGSLSLEKRDYGYWEGNLPGVESGDRYMIVIDDEREIPDPVSLFQPEGVHRESEVIDTASFRTDDRKWKGIPPADLIIYELHTGTFSPEGNFDGIIKKLDYLNELGINAIELMPVAQFPGSRNWGYDGVYPFAVQDSYGGPGGLSRLVSACHDNGIAVILDVVYNHLGPEGNYLSAAGPYFTGKYHTPWGSAVNFDDAWSHGVRRYFIENALMWLRDFNIDGLRLDAVHAIKDFGAYHFLAELADTVDRLNRETAGNHFLIGESDLNDARFIAPSREGGIGLDAQWCDEFHHALHARLTGERNGYYSDFGDTGQLADAYNNAFVYNGKYSPYRKRIFGGVTDGIPGSRFVICTQNHDQVGNRMLGERLTSLTGFESLKLAAGAMFFSPYIPMLFMGEEYGELAPFLYFTSHGDQDLVTAVREGRKKEFSDFLVDLEPPDPDSESTFNSSKLNWDQTKDDKKKKLLDYYKKLISIKKSHPALKPGNREGVRAVTACDGMALILDIESPGFFEDITVGKRQDEGARVPGNHRSPGSRPASGDAQTGGENTAGENQQSPESHPSPGQHQMENTAGNRQQSPESHPSPGQHQASGKIACGAEDDGTLTASGMTPKNYDDCGITAIMNFSENFIQLPFAQGSASGCSVLIYSAHASWGGPVNEFASLTGDDGTIIMEPLSILVLSDPRT